MEKVVLFFDSKLIWIFSIFIHITKVFFHSKTVKVLLNVLNLHESYRPLKAKNVKSIQQVTRAKTISQKTLKFHYVDKINKLENYFLLALKVFQLSNSRGISKPLSSTFKRDRFYLFNSLCANKFSSNGKWMLFNVFLCSLFTLELWWKHINQCSSGYKTDSSWTIQSVTLSFSIE